jgi:hypothetical protein
VAGVSVSAVGEDERRVMNTESRWCRRRSSSADAAGASRGIAHHHKQTDKCKRWAGRERERAAESAR